jgi:hypothetical protein
MCLYILGAHKLAAYALCIQHSLSKLSVSEDFNRAATVNVDLTGVLEVLIKSKTADHPPKSGGYGSFSTPS